MARRSVNEITKMVKTHYGEETIGNSSEYNESVRQSWLPIWMRNAGRSYSEVERRCMGFAHPIYYLLQSTDESISRVLGFVQRGDYAQVKKELAEVQQGIRPKAELLKQYDIKQLPHKPNKPVLLLGSGPSLDDWSPYIKDWEGDIICSTSQLAWLEYHGVVPTYCNLIDSDPEMNYLIANYGDSDKCTLISHPQAPREAHELWKGPVYYYLMHDAGDEFQGDGIQFMYGMVNEQFNWPINSKVTNLGNVMNCSIALAQQLEYAPIFLCGYDLGYPKKQYRFTNYEKKNNKWQQLEDIGIPPEREITRCTGNVWADNLCFFYKYSFMILFGMGAPPVISCSRGILKELSYASPERVVRNQGKGMLGLLYTMWESYKIAQTYLLPRRIYMFKGRVGYRLSLFKDWFYVGIGRPRDVAWVQNIDEVAWWRRLPMRVNFWIKRNLNRGWPRKVKGAPTLLRWVSRLWKTIKS
jgi:hypothetical protein